jgi:hypothetical protein
MVSLAEITKNINNNVHKKTIEIIAENTFEQKTSIPECAVKPQQIKETNKNEIVEIPKFCEQFIDKDNYYMYSSENFIHALLFSIDESFRLGISDQKKKQLELIQLIITKMGALFTKYKHIYGKKGFKKNKIDKYLKEINIHNLQEIDYSTEIVNLICDIKHINVIILSVETELYEKIESSEHSDINIVIVNENSYYYPLMNIHGVMYNSIDISNILTYFKKKIKLNKIGSYTLSELQLLANNNTIPINCNNSSKKKTKQTLYDELTLLT